MSWTRKFRAKRLGKRAEKVQRASYEQCYSDISEDETFFDQLEEQETLEQNVVETFSSVNEAESLHMAQAEVVAENERRNMDVVLELCSSLEEFVSEQESTCVQTLGDSQHAEEQIIMFLALMSMI